MLGADIESWGSVKENSIGALAGQSQSILLIIKPPSYVSPVIVSYAIY